MSKEYNPEYIKLGTDLQKLTNMDEWKSVEKLFEMLKEAWIGEMVDFNGKSVEDIALQKVSRASMIKTLDVIQVDVKKYINYMRKAGSKEE